MPAVPVFLNVFREVWEVKVLGNVYAEDLGDTYGDIDAAREVAVEVECVKEHRHENECPLKSISVRGKSDDRGSDAVCDHYLLEVAPDDPGKAFGDVIFLKLMLSEKGRRQIVISADRSLDHQRKKAHEQQKLERIFLRLGLAPVDVDKVANGLKRVVRDRGRNDDVKAADLGAFLKEGIDVGNYEIGVLGNAKKTYRDDKSYEKNCPLFGLGLGLNGFLLILGDRLFVGSDVRLGLLIDPSYQVRGDKCHDEGHQDKYEMGA